MTPQWLHSGSTLAPLWLRCGSIGVFVERDQGSTARCLLYVSPGPPYNKHLLAVGNSLRFGLCWPRWKAPDLWVLRNDVLQVSKASVASGVLVTEGRGSEAL